jgi:integrase
VLAASGREPFTSINKKSILAGREKRSSTPSQARKFLDTMRGLFRWALDADHIKVDPTARVKNPEKPRNNGFPAWTEEDVEAYQKRWPIGTRQRVWLDVLLYTGLRRSDAVRIGKQYVRNGIATLRTVKGSETIEVTLPILAVLQQTLDAGPTGDLAWVCGARWRPFAQEDSAMSSAQRLAPRHPEICAWRAEDCRDHCSEQRRYGRGTGGDLWLAGRSHGGALHQGGRPPPACNSRDDKSGRRENIYSRT